MSRKTFFKHVWSRFCAVRPKGDFFQITRPTNFVLLLWSNIYYYFKYFQTPENCKTSIRTIFYVFFKCNKNIQSNVVELIFLILSSVAILHKKSYLRKSYLQQNPTDVNRYCQSKFFFIYSFTQCVCCDAVILTMQFSGQLVFRICPIGFTS